MCLIQNDMLGQCNNFPLSIYTYVRMANSNGVPSDMSSFVLFPHRPVGRPVMEVDIDEVEYLCGFRFTQTCIENILGVSHSTLYRRLQEEGVSAEVPIYKYFRW